MHRMGAVRVSRELAVPQRDLVRWLEERIADPSVAAFCRDTCVELTYLPQIVENVILTNC